MDGDIDRALFAKLEAYYDAVPRASARVEDLGGFTLFVGRPEQPMYARPRLGHAGPVTLDELKTVLARQRELGVPQALEWVAEVTPDLEDCVAEAGLTIERCPLMVLTGPLVGQPGPARMLGPTELDDLRLARAAVGVAFTVGGTSTGAEGLAERRAAAEAAGPVDDSTVARFTAGALRMAAVYPVEADSGPASGPVGGGAHAPVGDTTEITGVGLLPAYRHQGMAAALSYVLARDALDHGVRTVFCSAENDDVARIYARTGFRRVGTACIAEA